MSSHALRTGEGWRAARTQLLEAATELTRRGEKE
jgi:predicted dithiol-disulfide oxidoreductase (DUF899 family)